MRRLSQIFAIARTEFRFSFRRGSPVAVTALIGLVVGAGIVIMLVSGLVDNPTSYTISWNAESVAKLATLGFTVHGFNIFMKDLAADMTTDSLSLTWTLMLLAFFLLPLSTATSIPADRQFGAGELLRSTPITGGSYLAGKILGVLAAVLLTASLTLMMFLVALDVVFHHFYQAGLPGNLFEFYVELTLLDGLPLLVWGTAIGVLTGVAFTTRRKAILPGLAMGLLSILFWGFAYSPVKSFSMVDLASSYVLQNYHSAAAAIELRLYGQAVPLTLNPGESTVSLGQVILMYGSAFLVLLLFATMARLWLKQKENF